jgi:hypothetical protein
MHLIFQKKKPKAEQGGFFYMGSSTITDKKLTSGAILIISKVLKHVMSSAAEAEIGAVFLKCQRRSSPSYNIGRIRALSAPHTNGDRQYHGHRLQQWHNKTKTHKSNGYALLLDQRQSKTRTI